MRVKIKSPRKFLASISAVVIIFIILFKGFGIISDLSQKNSNDTGSSDDAGKSSSVLNSRLLSVSDDGNIQIDENGYFQKYTIKLKSINNITKLNEDENNVYISVDKQETLIPSSRSFKEDNKEVTIKNDADGKKITIKKKYAKNNFIFKDEYEDIVTVLISKNEQPFNHKVVLDPGHGGVDPGTSAYDGSFLEKDVTLKIVRLIRPELIYNGCEVFLSREEDKTITLENIVKYSMDNVPDVFVSVHINYNDDGSQYNGLSTYYYKQQSGEESKKLAQIIQENMVKDDGWKDRGLVSDRLYVLRLNNVPSVLLECGFASNPGDVSRLMDNNVIVNLSKNITNGIVEYLNDNLTK